MRAAVVVLCGLGLAMAAVTGHNKDQQKPADKEFLRKQFNVLTLFFDIQKPSHATEQVAYANNFSFEKQRQNSTDPSAVKFFQNAYQQGLLPRDQPFNYFDFKHRHQAGVLFTFFYFAKDFETFYTAACWARQNVNGGMFAYAFSVAVLNRPDTQGIMLPPQSEIFPYLYVNARAVQQAQYKKQQGANKAYVQSNLTNGYYWNPEQGPEGPEDFPFSCQAQSQFNSEYTDDQYQENREARVSYYSEDINLNQQFAYEQLKHPAWLTGEKPYQLKTDKSSYKESQKTGEIYFYYLQQALARYNLERFANDLPAVRPFQFNQNIKYGYNPQLQYYFGQSVPARPDHFDLDNAHAEVYEQFQLIDSRIAEVVDSNQARKEDGTYVQLDDESGVETVSSLIQNVNSINYKYYGARDEYGYLEQCRRVVGSASYSASQSQNVPSALESDNTANRDSAFYRCVARLVGLVQQYKNKLKPYNQQQLSFGGVKVQNVKLDKLVTYFDAKEVELFNAISYNFQKNEDPWNFQYRAFQQQLNHKPFNYQIQVDSAQDGVAVVRVFIGQKYSGKLFRRMTLEQARHTFVEIDRFTYNLKSGQNVIQRNSQQSTRFQQAAPLFKEIFNAVKGGQPFTFDPELSQRQAVFPQNLILPKGLTDSNQFVLAVAVNQFQGSQKQDEQQQPQDGRPEGFPFDRVVDAHAFRQAKNVYFRTIKVYNGYYKNQ